MVIKPLRGRLMVGDQPDHAGDQRAEDRGWNGPLFALKTDSEAAEADCHYRDRVEHRNSAPGTRLRAAKSRVSCGSIA
jgi:hypothetical protein